MKRLSVVAALCLSMTGLFGSGSAQAILVARDGGMLYDTVLNVTWLQDANYAKTSGYDTDGLMTWAQAKTWADNLVHGGYSDWRLARNSPVNGTASGWNYNGTRNGSTDFSYNITSTFSELSYMYYANLGLKGLFNPNGTSRFDSGVNGNGTAGGQKDVGTVKNLQNSVYWSGTAYALSPAGNAWGFNTSLGLQGNFFQGDEFFAWAVRDGDVAVVPLPGSVALLAGGLALLGVVSRRRGRSVTSSD